MKSLSSQHDRRGELWALGSVAGYASAYIFDRVAVIHADPLVGPFLRGIPSLVLGIVLVWKNRMFGQVWPRSEAYAGNRAVAALAVAGAVSTVGLFAQYFALRLGGVIVTVPVVQTYGLWGTLGAWLFLRERVRPVFLLGFGLLVAGVAAVSLGELRGWAHGWVPSPAWYWAIPLACGTALTYGIAGVFWRDSQLRGAHQSTAILIQFVASLATALGGLALAGRLRLISTTPARDLAALLISGVLSGIVGVYCIFMALRLMRVARVFAYTSLTPLVATGFAYFFLHEYLNLLMLAGVVLACFGLALTQIFRPQEE